MRRAIPVLAAAAALVAAGCGGTHRPATRVTDTLSLSPAAAVTTGVQGLFDGSALTMTAGLSGSPAALQAVASAGGGHALSATDLQLASTATVVLAARAGGRSFAADDGGERDGSLALTVAASGDPALVQLIYAGQTLYARADLTTIAGVLGEAGEVARIAAEPDLPGTYAFLRTAAGGGWVSVSYAALVSQLKTSSPSGIPTVSPGQAGDLRSALEALLRSDVSATRAPADPTLGDHLVLTADSHALVAGLLAATTEDLADLPGVPELLRLVPPGGAPAQPVRIEAYVRDGTLDALSIDLGQLLDPAQRAALAGRPLAVTVRFSPAASVTPPAGAAVVSPSALAGLLTLAGG
jgi:hypothetical protein